MQFSTRSLPGGNVWSVDADLADVGSIDNLGNYTAPAVAPHTPVLVTVRSAQFPGLSGSASVTILNPAPVVASVSPPLLLSNSGPTTISAAGSGFNRASVVTINGTVRTAQCMNTGWITISLTASDVQNAGVLQVLVTNPAPGGGASNQATVPIENPAPVLTSISPAGVQTGSAPVAITLSGGGFIPSSTVFVNGKPRAMQYLSSGAMQITVSADELVHAATLAINVTNGAPGGGQSDAVRFTISNPAPVVQALSPDMLVVGSNSHDVSIQGNGFTPDSSLTLNGSPLPVHFISSTELQMSLPDSQLLHGTIQTAVVSNPAPGGGQSAPAQLMIANPAPSVSAVSPLAVLAGTVAGTVHIVGIGFVADTTASVGGTAVAVHLVSDKEIDIDVPSDLYATAGTVNINVSNSQPRGGKASASLAVLAVPAAAATVHPLVAEYTQRLPAGYAAYAEFGPDVGYGLRTSVQPAAEDGTMRLLVAGMRPTATYHMRLHTVLPDGSEVVSPDQAFTTGAIDTKRIPPVTITGTSPGDAVELLNLVTGTSSQLRIAAVDLTGNLVWYYDYPLSQGVPLPIKPLSNGNMRVVLTRTSQLIREIDLTGQTVRELTLDTLNSKLSAMGSPIVAAEIHHDFAELPDGKLVLLVSEVRQFTDLPGYPGMIRVLGDSLVEVDRDWNVLWTWSSFDHLDVNRHPWFVYLVGQLPDPVYDWTHTNAVVYSSVDKSLLVSMRHQNWVLKIDFNDGAGTGQLLWKLGPGGDFKLVGGSDPIDWFYDQHYVTLISAVPGQYQLALFDNGDMRPFDAHGTTCGPTTVPCYSRPVLMNVDEANSTATLTWAPHVDYSDFGGSIQKLDNGHMLFALSHDTTAHAGCRVVEVTTDQQPQTVWQLDTPQYCYRAVRLPSPYPGVTW